MSPSLRIVLEPVDEGLDDPIVITEGEFSVGRREPPFSNQEAARASRLSRQHARIFEREGQAFATDLGSTNGTYVNHEKLGAEPMPLNSGDQIDFGGKFQFRVSIEPQQVADVTVFEEAAPIEIELVPQLADLPALTINRFPFLVTRNLAEFEQAKVQFADAVALLSRRQAMFTLVNKRVCLEDLASANGTFVDNVPLAGEPTPIEDGALLRFGHDSLTYRVRIRDLDADRTVIASEASIAQPAAAPTLPELANNELLNLDFKALAAQGVVASGDDQLERVQEFRRIKRQLLQNFEAQLEDPNANPRNLVLITSSVAGEGKTFVAANLALSLAAEMDHHVLLVDADPSQRALSKLLGMTSKTGFVDRLAAGDANVDPCILRTNVERLHLLPCGGLPAHLDELYASALMRRLLLNLAVRDSRRIIVFDGPPLLSSTESGVLAKQMGQTMLVVEANKTKQQTVRESVDRLSGCQDVSLVLNKIEPAF